MAMDYGMDSSDPDFMAASAISSGQALHDYLKPLYPNLTDAQLWSMVAITPMIGKNDNGNQPFSLDNATKLLAAAKTRADNNTPYGGIRFWSLDRDNNPGQDVSGGPTHSGVEQQDWDFTKILRQASGY